MSDSERRHTGEHVAPIVWVRSELNAIGVPTLALVTPYESQFLRNNDKCAALVGRQTCCVHE